MTTNNSKADPLMVLGKADYAPGGLQGYCTTTYATLVAILGEPHYQGGDKTNVEWCYRCADGTVFSIYDWKLPSVPINEYQWHIGGSGKPLAAFQRFTGLKARPYTLTEPS